MMKRHMARELAVQSLFQMELSDLTAQEAIEFAVEGKEYDTFVEQLVNGVETNKATIDQHIREALVNWSFERLGNIERTILRLAVYELLFETNIPVRVTINEAIELTKAFADEEATKIVNGVLGKVAQGVVKENS
ncbi:transcription antitermination factor NusB [Exiguobacterium sp. A1_3_1]|jgi:N utilization substance protein B|uniref:Transcription antitermination protein NusB n=2 Tax=Exiguobacterium TaxID=33986 RepID=A0ABX8GBJ6_EXIAC|nr:transcription antitermination protein NusB [Exiguobacterium sp. MH3]MBF8153798.1 transcription antitermination factor NusB [Exiguobacterium sp. TBG-PICH-001]NTY08848.1 transcription antitermination factor NusB [Exiguobacterium sp. JMULE1]QWB30998.1 transcription antitermination factor NusB [Exiguobacterium acetylicum]SDC48420.1 NusB antitermination factor [Exiguobacterium enclense]HBQ76986.1 transcription antitermination factor NusB [Exiguobacterium sp.]